MFPDSINKFIENFSRLPSVGPRMATRLAFFLINKDNQSFKKLVESFSSLEKVDNCPKCFFVKDKENKLCSICSKKNRDQKTVMIVEKETDLISIEKSKNFNGLYLVLGDLDNRGNLKEEQRLRLKSLKTTAKKNFKDKFDEIIIALSPKTENDLMSQKIKEELKDYSNKITRIGRGIPTGGEVEFADEDTLSNAIDSRK